MVLFVSLWIILYIWYMKQTQTTMKLKSILAPSDKSIILYVDGNPTTLEYFIRANTDGDVVELTRTELDLLDSLDIGESCYIGMCLVERIK